MKMRYSKSDFKLLKGQTVKLQVVSFGEDAKVKMVNFGEDVSFQKVKFGFSGNVFSLWSQSKYHNYF